MRLKQESVDSRSNNNKSRLKGDDAVDLKRDEGGGTTYPSNTKHGQLLDLSEGDL